MATAFFFFMALCIFAAGVTMLTLTFKHWYTEWKRGLKYESSKSDVKIAKESR